jgi:predicted nucleotidyltransferase
MIDVTDQILGEMARAIVREADPQKIILFGSRGRGTAIAGSDVDLVVVSRNGFGPDRSRRRELARIRQALSPFRVAKDILVFSPEEVEKWKDSLNHVLAEALREGKLLYERP